MLNHRFLTKYSDPQTFVKNAIEFIKKHVENKKVFCALSGGIDSSTTYLLLKKAGVNVLPVFIDHGLMRIIRGKEEKDHIKKTFPDVKIVDIRKEFLPQIYNEEDAEQKRKLFKKAYAETFDKIIRAEKCQLLADGTILPDLEESFGVGIDKLKETMTPEEEIILRESQKGKGFVKSQHNVEIQYQVEATIQPVAALTKNQIREVLKYLGVVQELIYRKAFPGPALAARIVGKINEEKLAFEKEIHDIIESTIDDYYLAEFGRSMIVNTKGEQEPFQAFGATFENVETSKVTGMKDGKRTYNSPKCIKGKYDFEKLVAKAEKIEGANRLFYLLGEKRGQFDVVIRCINSIDARTASVTNLPENVLDLLKKKLLKIEKVRKIFFDVTPKPPGTIEYV